jgi:hypothetical protein
MDCDWLQKKQETWKITIVVGSSMKRLHEYNWMLQNLLKDSQRAFPMFGVIGMYHLFQLLSMAVMMVIT